MNMVVYPESQITEMQNEIDMLHADNALNLTQILDLEILLYNVSVTLSNGSPCWCRDWHGYLDPADDEHIEDCAKAREATAHLWRK